MRKSNIYINKVLEDFVFKYQGKGTILLIIIPLLIFIFFVFYTVKKMQDENISTLISTEANEQIENLKLVLEETEKYTLLLSRLNFQQAKDNALIKQLVKNTDYIDHIRYIAVDGQEIVRIDRHTNYFYPLKNVSHRNYHPSIISLKEGETYISPINLNREGVNNQIEIPLKPVSRIAVPIYKDNTIQGYIITNILPQTILNDFQDSQLRNKYQAELMVIDEKGYFVKHPDSSLEFGNDLGNLNNKAEYLLDKSLGNFIANNPSGGLISNITFNQQKYLAYVKKIEFNNLNFVILIPKSIAYSQFNQFLKWFLLGCFLIIISIIILSRKIYKLTNKVKESQLEKEVIKISEAQKSQFFSSMSHEIRTPLTAIIGITEIMLNKFKDNEIREFLEIIKSSGSHLLQLINEILDLSKLEAKEIKTNYEKFDLEKLIKEIIDSLKPVASQKNLELYYEFELEIQGYFVGDNFRIRQVLTNLISNGIKFTEKGHVKVIISKKKQYNYRTIKRIRY